MLTKLQGWKTYMGHMVLYMCMQTISKETRIMGNFRAMEKLGVMSKVQVVSMSIIEKLRATT